LWYLHHWKGKSISRYAANSLIINEIKIVVAIAELLGSKVFVTKDKKIILDCLESKDISNVLCTEESNSRIHVLPMMRITLKVTLVKLEYHFEPSQHNLKI